MISARHAVTAALLLMTTAAVPSGSVTVDWAMVAKIREEGLQRSRVMDFESYMTDVLGARLTMSRDMQRAQRWASDEMTRLGLVNVAFEPFMDYGVTWDNEYVSLHLLEPDYTPMTGYPIAHTNGTNGRVVAEAVIVDLQSRADLERYRGTLRGKAVLVTPPVRINLEAMAAGTPRLTDSALAALEHVVIVPPRIVPPRAVRNPDVLTAVEKTAFYAAQGVAVVMQSEGGGVGSVWGFSRPGSRDDFYARAGMLSSPAMVAITPEHYNRMYRILARGMPVQVEVEVRNRIGERVEQAANIIGEIPGTDLKDEVVMIGAHFDTWHASPNSSDNTSGVAVALEAARILKAVGAKPRRTIRVALWNGEEQGLWGSRAYVRNHFGSPRDSLHPPRPAYEKLSAYFNQDYGAGQYRGIYLQGNESARTMMAAWMEPFRDFGMTTVSSQSVGSTDHVPFDDAGLPGFQFIQDRLPGSAGHTNLDYLETINPNDLMKNAVVMASYAWHAAMAESLVPRKRLSK